MMFLPWDYGFAGQYTTEPTVGGHTVYKVPVGYDGSANAFALHEGWIPLVCLAVILYFCGRSRRELGGRVWFPFWAAVMIVLCAADAFSTQNRLMNAWLAGFDPDHKPQAQIAAAIYWTFLLGVIMTIAAFRHAKHSTATP